MKKIIFILFLVLFSVNLYAQPWTSQQVSTGYIMSICFSSNSIGCAVGGGNNQNAFATTNGGANWTLTNNTSSLSWVTSVNINTFFAAGSSGLLLKSTNGGYNWTTVFSNSPYGELMEIQFTSADTGYIYSDNGSVLKTVNGGTNWVQYQSNAVQPKDICFINSMTGYLCQLNAQPMKTTNGGINWTAMSTGQSPQFHRLYFLDTLKGFICKSGEVLKTTNGGVNWSTTAVSAVGTMRGIYFKTNLIGFVYGGNGIYKTTNGGNNWNQLTVPASYEVMAMHFPSLDTGYATTLNGYILKTVTGGASFIRRIDERLPSKYSLTQNYPNPFNQCTMFNVQCPIAGNVQVKVFDITGKEMATLVNETLLPGTYEVAFDAGNLSSGIYYYRLQTDNFIETKKMILLK